jgi:hypothetical protein
MLKKETLQEIAKRLGIEADELQKLIASDKEETIELKTVHLFEDAELLTLKENSKREGYTEGKKAGLEMAIKDEKEKHGLEFEGKTIDNLLNSFKKKIETDLKVEPNKKIQELTADLEKVRQTLTQTEQEKQKEVEAIKNQLKQTKIESRLSQLLPEKTDNGLTRDDLKTLYFAKRQIDEDESGLKIIDRLTNEILKDKTQSPIKLETDIETFLIERNIRKIKGRGGDNENPPDNGIDSLRKRTDVETYFEENNIPISERAPILAKAMKNEGFDIRS